MKTIKEICGASSPIDFIASLKPLLECTGIKEDQFKEFSYTLFETFADFRPNTDLLEKDYSSRLLQMLRKSTRHIERFQSAIVVVAPDSMMVQNVLPHTIFCI